MVRNLQDPPWKLCTRFKKAQDFTHNNMLISDGQHKLVKGVESKVVPIQYVEHIDRLHRHINEARQAGLRRGIDPDERIYYCSLSSYLNQLRLNFWNELPQNAPGAEWRSRSLYKYLCRERLGFGHDDEQRELYCAHIQRIPGQLPYKEDLFIEQENLNDMSASPVPSTSTTETVLPDDQDHDQLSSQTKAGHNNNDDNESLDGTALAEPDTLPDESPSNGLQYDE
ncbi:hypothetical protein FRC02_000798 [Tulasnella sp. 418]|nr:hypothetical protein FRC02_000798 [Tulasnella sp. 418]